MEDQHNTSRSILHVWIYSVLLFFLSIFVVLAAGEILVRLLVPKEFYLPINNIYSAVSSDIGYTYKPNFNGVAFGVPLTTNSYGFRGTEWSLQKEKNTVRIALIGDSHAFGYGVRFDDTVGEKLALFLRQKTEKKYEVLNFGVAGYNSRQELAVLREKALKFEPDVIIIVPCNNDHDEAMKADEQGFLRTAKNAEVIDKSINILSVNTSSWIIENCRLAFYVLFLKKQQELRLAMPEQLEAQGNKIADDNTRWMGAFEDGPIPDKLQKSVYEPLAEIINEAKKRNILIVIASFNSVPEYRRLFAKLAHDANVPAIELLALFPGVNSWKELLQQFGLGWNNHLNGIAHERWAQALYILLKDKLSDRESRI